MSSSFRGLSFIARRGKPVNQHYPDRVRFTLQMADYLPLDNSYLTVTSYYITIAHPIDNSYLRVTSYYITIAHPKITVRSLFALSVQTNL